MTKKKKIIIAAVSAAAAAAIIAGSVAVWNMKKTDDSLGTVYVTSVSDCNTAATYTLGNRFSGVVESQKAVEVKVDSDKIIKEVLVNEGDSVNEGDELFVYDVEAMKLELEEGQVEIERMNNDIDSTKRQITELENEKKNAGSDNQVSYTTQIQSLQTDIDRIQYDIKVKNISLEKLKNSIDNSSVKAAASGTVKGLKTTDEMAESGTNVMMTIASTGSFRVKGKINEQNMGAFMQGDAVIITSRIDDSVSWKGTISEISNEPEANNDMYYYGGDSDSMSSNYAFYIDPESTEGLMLGQHVLIEIDYGQSSTIEKEGIWLFNDYIMDIDGDKPYVWAADKNGKLEKRYVKVGQRDEMNGDSEILSGIKDSDLIAYPAEDYEEGMKTTTDIEDIDFDDDEMFNDGMIDGEMPDDVMIDGEMIDGEMLDGEMIDGEMIDGEMPDDVIIDDGEGAVAP